MALFHVVSTLRAERDGIEAPIAALRRQLDRAARDPSLVYAVLTRTAQLAARRQNLRLRDLRLSVEWCFSDCECF